MIMPVLTKTQCSLDKVKSLLWKQTENHPLGQPRYYAVLNYSYSFKGQHHLQQKDLRQRWDRRSVFNTHSFINGLIRKTFGRDIPIWWTIERCADYEDDCGNTKKGMFHSNCWIGEISDEVLEYPSSHLLPLFAQPDDFGIPIGNRSCDIDALKLLLLGACIRQAKWVGSHPRSLFIEDVPPNEMEASFMYGLKDINSSMNQLNTVIDWDNSSFYKP